MTSELSVPTLLSRFKLPATDLAELTFASSSRPASVKAWAEALPATRITHTSVLLYKAIPEISRLQTSAENRLAMLEAVRPYVQHCIQALARGFLNQPLILPEGPLKTAVVAQALQKHMCAAYEQVIVELCTKIGDKEATPNLVLACHRAVTGLGLLLLRGYQLYRQIPNNLWLELHTLYQLADEFNILESTATDPLLEYATACTISQAYLRALLLACARPNQMRQLDVSATYHVLEAWCYLAKLQPVNYQKQDNLFVVNLGADLAPLYKSRFAGGSQAEIRELDIQQLINALRKQRDSKDGKTQLIPIPTSISVSLLEHLEQAWSVTKQRAFERQPSSESIEVCVGLSNIHHHIINGISLDEFLGRDEVEEIDFGSFASSDPWSASLANSSSDETDDHPMFLVQIVDTSPGGYCLEWRNKIPALVKAGEAIGLRERGRHRWGLGVIRWVHQENNATRLGIQLLAPKATPFAAALETPTGDYGDYLRVLMLPELKAANQPATLITAFAPFQEYQRLMLNSNGEATAGQLNRRIFSTGCISQFTFRAEAKASADTSSANQAPATDTNADAGWDD